MTWDAVIAGFRAECDALSAVLAGVDDAFARTTNCPPWDLRELVVHIAFSACTLPRRFPDPAPDAVVISAADYYRRAERSTSEYRTANVDQTQRAAAGYPTGQGATALFESSWRATSARLDELDADRLMASRASVAREGELLNVTAISIGDYFVTRVVAMAAHALDVAITLEHSPWTTPEALAVVTPALLELLGGTDPRADLGWDDVTFVAAATGRRPLDDAERTRLAGRAELFPLLS